MSDTHTDTSTNTDTSRDISVNKSAVVDATTETATVQPHKTRLKAVGDNVLVLLDLRVDQSAGGIAIPIKAQKAEEWGLAVSVGSKVESIVSGETVFVPRHLGTLYNEGGREYVIIQADKILAKRI